MRRILVALGLIFAFVGSPRAFEIEETHKFEMGPTEIAVLSTTDIEAIRPLIVDFLDRNPEFSIRYDVAASNQIFQAIHDEGVPYDLVMSSAMDLQLKLANDGFARSVVLPAAAQLPDWAEWRNRLFGINLDPVVLLMSREALKDLPRPRTRRDLVALLRDNVGLFNERVGIYNPEISGVGYMLITQDARQSDSFWRLAEVLGRLNARLYCCSGEMIEDLRQGRIAMAYNVIGSYNQPTDESTIERIDLEDFTLALLRTGLVPSNAENPQGGAAFLNDLLGIAAQSFMAEGSGIALIRGTGPQPSLFFRPIRLDSGLLVHLDRSRKQSFIAEWRAAMAQE